MITDEAIEELKLRFTSGNSVPVERAFLKQAEFNAIIERLEAAERDAARYRWLRDIGHLASTKNDLHVADFGSYGDVNDLYRNKELDCVIDTAIAAEQGNKHDH